MVGYFTNAPAISDDDAERKRSNARCMETELTEFVVGSALLHKSQNKPEIEFVRTFSKLFVTVMTIVAE